ncbi:MAG TPA: glycerol-3-phosphate dehydrogenase/oxidase [Anaerolineae bacterium]|nr:glycerol-3-phosphate dehydrogenase/oxidase [Anaerolineae bacterium]
MWPTSGRETIWSQLHRPWDVIVIGGGVTGAGILRLLAPLGVQVLLVERADFSYGTSSRSTKLVHGGLRYLAQKQYSVTRESVRERERLMREAPGLIDPLGCLFPVFRNASPKKQTAGLALAIYDLFGHKWAHRYYEGDDLELLAPHISLDGLQGGFRYFDAVTDDSRLVLRLLAEGVQAGGVALNYVAAESLLQDAQGRVRGVALRDQVSGRTLELQARVVINATGAWADHLRQQVGGSPRVRPSRGSHFLFPFWRAPAAQAVTLFHPRDGRPVFVIPWEGATLAGTTDIDHRQPLDEEPSAEWSEVEYVLEALTLRFPAWRLSEEDIVASFAGVRPIVASGTGVDPHKESRRHAVLEENGLVTITGGKLTTFRRMALDTLRQARVVWPELPLPSEKDRVLAPVAETLPITPGLDEWARRRLLGHYAAEAAAVADSAQPGELDLIPGTDSRWVELRWAARQEAVVHLEDLLLRRVRLGLVLPEGGLPILERVRSIVQPELGWDDARWDAEVARYTRVWRDHYSVPTATG